MKFLGLFYGKILKFALADKETNRLSLIKLGLSLKIQKATSDSATILLNKPFPDKLAPEVITHNTPNLRAINYCFARTKDYLHLFLLTIQGKEKNP